MYSPDEEHLRLLGERPALAFDPAGDPERQREDIRAAFLRLLGETPQRTPPNAETEYVERREGYTEYRISLDTEPGVRAVFLLCIPDTGKNKYPLFVCLAGHGTGMHVMLGRKKWERDDPGSGDRDYALHVLERGYAALVLEQRGMGERRTGHDLPKKDVGAPRCRYTAMNALLTGRTMIMERCWDVSRALDHVLEAFPVLDGTRIGITGNSGGGTTSFYAACLDKRIGYCMPSCSVCTYRDSIGAVLHCECNYIPGIARLMDMGDLSILIAPRKLAVIAGAEDPIFPRCGVEKTFETVQAVYAAAGVPDNCLLAFGDGAHRYYKKEAWDAFDRLCGWEV